MLASLLSTEGGSSVKIGRHPENVIRSTSEIFFALLSAKKMVEKLDLAFEG